MCVSHIRDPDSVVDLKMAESAISVDLVKINVLKEFTDITMTGEPTAIQYLDKHRWDITEALNSYFSSSQGNPSEEECDMDENSGTASHPILIDSSPISKRMGVSSVRVDPEQNARDNNLILLTWNIDGLSEKQLVERTRYVCELINTRHPDVVFLQEVIDDTLLAFHRRCNGYTTVCGKHASGYFNAIMLKDKTVKPAGPLEEMYFSQSTMGRHLLMQPAIFNQQIKLVLMTSHLESTANCKQERKGQLKIVFNKMLSQNPECTVIFGGDTNLRDIEVGQVGIPNEVSDAWEACGKADDTKFTWDVSVNDNLDWQFPNKPKLRFDRVYARPGQNENCLEPLEFSLVGKQRLASGVYPSDHWGIWCKFVKKTAEKH